MAHWPTAAALAKGDTKAIRWFASVALLERIALMRGNPILEAARRHLVELVSKEPLWESVLWAAFSLKDHEITSPIVSMPIYGLNPQLGPHQWISFAVRVDAAELKKFTTRVARRLRIRLEKQHGKTE
jgi:hypothetical protein